MHFLVLSLFLFASSQAQAGLSKVQCWETAINQKQQDANEQICIKARDVDQKCSTNWNETGLGIYAVCLMKAEGALELVSPSSVFKGYNQSEQDQNLIRCRQVENAGQICITRMVTHKQAAYDVCLMKPALGAKKNLQKAPSQVSAQPKAVNRIVVNRAWNKSKPYSYISKKGRCFPADVNGKAFGSHVEDAYCSIGYNSNGKRCFNVDAKGVRYGSPMEDYYCKVGYGVNADGRCQFRDANGLLYGSFLEDEYCRR